LFKIVIENIYSSVQISRDFAEIIEEWWHLSFISGLSSLIIRICVFKITHNSSNYHKCNFSTMIEDLMTTIKIIRDIRG